jgi:hypothetical protein
MKTKHYLITATAAYLLFLLVYTPASVAITTLKKSLPQIKIEGVGGTIWNGSAQRITYTNKYIVENANWSICIWRLITGEACVELDGRYNDNDFHGEIGVNAAGTLKVRDLRTILNAETLGEQVKLPLGKLSGNIFLDIEQIKWAGDSIPAAEGVIKWSNAAITFAEKTDLGVVSIQIIEADDYPLTATISNNGGHVAISGQTNVGDDGAYSLELRLLPRNNASTNLSKNLGVFTKKQSDGSYLVENSGNLKQLGLM